VTTPTKTPDILQADPDWRQDSAFTWPESVPWSVLGPQVAKTLHRSDPKDPQPEHIEIIGQNGSGKTHVLGKIYQGQAVVRPDRTRIIVATKPADGTLLKIGFPVVGTWKDLVKKVNNGEQNLIFWPRTRLMGAQRKAFYDNHISDLIDRLYVPESDTDIAIDDWGFAEKLAKVRERLEQLLREGRSSGLSVAAMKQRPQGATRLMSSETQWTIGFKPKDDEDLERWAQLFGSRRDWMPVLRSVDRAKRQFVVKNTVTGDAYISWVDEPLAPLDLKPRRRGMREVFGLGRAA
jgi:hypothetical protein